MTPKKWIFILIAISWAVFNAAAIHAEKLTEEQMAEYRIRPAVVLIYSGMYVDIALKSGQTFKVPNFVSGSGFFVNPDGYLVTSGNVVETYVKYMEDKNGYAQKVFEDFIVNKIVTEFKQGQGRQPGQEEFNTQHAKFIKTHEPFVSNHGAVNLVLLSNAGGVGKSFNFEVKKFSPSIPEGGKNIALLKIQRDNCPVLMLGDSSKLSMQQPVFTIGYPAVVDPNSTPSLNTDTTLESSIARGAVSALKTDFEGIPVIRHDAATSHGHSGGPTLDIKGRVIGVFSYAASKYNGFKFCIPSNIAKEFIRETGIKFNIPTEFTEIFDKLSNSVNEEKWFEAKTRVTTALAYMKSEPGLEKLQRMILTNINEMGILQKVWSQHQIIVIIAGILIILILIVLKFAFSPSAPERNPREVIEAPPTTAPSPSSSARVPGNTGRNGGSGMKAVGSVSIMYKGEDKGSFSIPASGIYLGRDPAVAGIFVAADIVSKRHMRITPKGDGFLLVDMNSTNGTFVNGEQIAEREIGPQDYVQLGKKGDVKLIFNK
ncbi:MAG: FHA domain-containing protein [bacterium]|nr:FHA domain-containing protein [bacterium]